MRTGRRAESRPGTRCSHDAEIMVLPHARGSARRRILEKEQRSLAAARACRPLSVNARARLGRELGNASGFAEVTGSGLRHVKIVRVFELVLLNSAPVGFEPTHTAPEAGPIN